MLVPARCPLCGHGVSLDSKWFVASIVTQRVDEHGRCVISVEDGFLCLEIYDDYRE